MRRNDNRAGEAGARGRFDQASTLTLRADARRWPGLTEAYLAKRAKRSYSRPMNAHDPAIGQPATLHYGDGEFAVLKPGRYVLCAVSGQRIALEQLRYWSAERQEAYAGPAEAMKALGISR